MFLSISRIKLGKHFLYGFPPTCNHQIFHNFNFERNIAHNKINQLENEKNN